MVESTQKALGDLDIAVNNAGVISIKGIAELGADDWDQVMAVNARGVPVHKGRSGRDAAS
jgi:meso-butanediol dehydrogenase/(S,S)-butanediol dehydrogenase/diacetyl reductase